MRKNKVLITALISFVIACLVACAKAEPKLYEVCGKYEADGKCYINVWVEVDPMDYIGLDVGDEYNGE